MPRSVQGRYFIVTLSAARNVWTPSELLLEHCQYAKGQLELGEGGFLHWQFVLYFASRRRLAAVLAFLPAGAHAEVVRNRQAALDYVGKDDTCADVESRFEFGQLPFARNSATDWAAVRRSAGAGDYDSIPDDIMLRYTSNILLYGRMNLPEPPQRDNINARYYYGVSGAGKSHQAFTEARALACEKGIYVKLNSNKWWDGYKGQRCVVIDDFEGQIGLAHLKRWLDKFPCFVEVKGGTVPLLATEFWITSNYSIQELFPNANAASIQAIRRRLRIVHYQNPFQ